MKFNLKHVSIAGTMLALSSTAFADLVQSDVDAAQGTTPDTLTGANQQTGTTFSSLIFFAYNPDGSFSSVQTLGLRGDKPAGASPLFTQPLTDAPGTLLNFSLTNAAGIAANAGTLQWGIMSVDNSGSISTAATVNLLTTVNSSSVLTGPGAVLLNSAGITGTGTSVKGFLTDNASANDSVSSTTAGATDNWTTNNGNTATLTSTIGAAAASNSTLAMYLFSNSASANSNTAATYAAYAGTWSLNAATGIVSYAVNAVPVPAAVWLLLSGLGGLGVVGRRRAVAAA